MCKVIMRANKETKGTIRFGEIVATGKDPIIGTLYVPKNTLNIMGFKEGMDIEIDISLKTDGDAPAPAPEPAKKTTKRATKKAAEKEDPAKTPAKRRGRPKKAAAEKTA